MALREAVPTDGRFEEFLAARTATAKVSSVGTYRRQLEMIDRVCRARFGGKCFLDMDRAGIRRLAAELAQQRSGYLLATMARMVLRHHDLEHLAKDLRVRTPRARIDPRTILTTNDVNKLLAATGSARDAALVAVLFETGGRVSEVLALRWNSLRPYRHEERKRDLLKVWFHQTKIEGEEHDVLLVDSVPWLERWMSVYRPRPRRDDSPLFPSFEAMSRGRPLTPGATRRILKDLAEVAGVRRPVNPHAFKHARASFLARKGWSEAMIRKAVGWSPGSRMPSRYTHLRSEDVDNGILKLHGLEPQPETAEDEPLAPPPKLRPSEPIPPEEPEISLPSIEATLKLKEDPRIKELADAVGADVGVLAVQLGVLQQVFQRHEQLERSSYVTWFDSSKLKSKGASK